MKYNCYKQTKGNTKCFKSLTRLLDRMPSFCAAVASPIALCPQSSLPIAAYVHDIIAMGKKYVIIMKATLYLK